MSLDFDELQKEIDHDRRWEWRLIYKAAIAFAAIVVLVVIRQVFFV